MEIELIALRQDNYSYWIRDPATQVVGIVDPADAEGVEAFLARKGGRLDFVLNTHHHYDHVDGNILFKEKYQAKIVGPLMDEARIPGLDVAVSHKSKWQFGSKQVEILDTPGHTRGAICFWFTSERAVFCGDTLFSMGCGRLFEGTPEQMWESLKKLRNLPDDTKVFCGHEYTLANAKFAMTVDPDNKELLERFRQVEKLRAKSQPTIPTTIGLEKKTNPFLRADVDHLRASLNMLETTPEEVFAKVRSLKDNF